MLAHLSMKYRTDLEGIQHQEVIDSLPKAIRSSISHHLFYSLVDKVYLFNGVSNDILFQLVIFLPYNLFVVLVFLNHEFLTYDTIIYKCAVFLYILDAATNIKSSESIS